MTRSRPPSKPTRAKPAPPDLGVAEALHRAGRIEEAEAAYRRLLAAGHPEGIPALAVICHQSGRFEEALTLAQAAIAGDPRRAEWHDLAGSVLARLARPAEAAAAHRTATTLAPDRAAFHYNLGNALDAAGTPAAALAAYQQAIALNPRHANARYNLGNVLRKLGRPDEAAAAYRAALALEPHHLSALINLGTALIDGGDGPGAIAVYRRALALAPDQARISYNLALALQNQGAFEEAEIHYRQCLAREPDRAEALDHLGTVLRRLDRPDQAERCHRRALALKPGFAQAAHNLGNALHALGRFAEADAAFAAALASEPGLSAARYNQGLLKLAKGNLISGWDGYEERFRAGEALPDRRFDCPRWTGEPLAGRRLLVWREQGIGDELMFATCYRDALPADGVTVECDPRLVPLIARLLPAATVRGETAGAAGRTAAKDADCQTPAGSLPQLARRSLGRFGAGPTLTADPGRVARGRHRLAALGPGLRVGICWRSRLITRSRRAAYTCLAAWGPVFAVPGVVPVNLQYDDCEAELQAAERQFGVTIARWPDLDLADDLDETAALIAALDLVITAPTSVGELAGALGVPVWRFGPAGDWTQCGTRVRPWFDSMRVFPVPWAMPAAGILSPLARALTALVPAAVAASPRQDPEQRFEQAVADHRAGLLAAADAGYRAVLAQVPDHADALHLLGLTAHQQGRHEEALALIDQALAVCPAFPRALHHRALALIALDRVPAAITSLEQALTLDPKLAEALTHLGRLIQDRGRRAEAEALHRRALALAPDLADAHTNLGYLHETDGRYPEAEACYRRALALRPRLAQAHVNLGTALQAQNRPALDHFERALALDPDCALAHWNRGLIRLARGDLAGGWDDYDWRFAARQLQPGRRPPVPAWNGAPLAGRRLLVWAEQGLGDELLFATTYPDLVRRSGGRLLLECDRRLVPLLERALPDATVRPETADAARRETRRPPDFDLHCAAGSVPRRLRPTLAAFPAGVPPVLTARPDLAARFKDLVAALGPGLKVGLCWRSQLVTAGRRSAYSRITDWGALFALPDICWINLQYDECAAELAAVRHRFGTRIATWPENDLKDDQETMAAVIAACDLVISAGTAVAELAGALGVPVWRFGAAGDEWTLLGTPVRPWFGSMTVFRPVRTDEPAAAALPRMARRLAALAAAAAQARAAAAAPPATGPSPERDLAAAAEAHQAGRTTEAERGYRRVLADDPQNPVALHLLGLLAHQRGDPATAIALIGRAVAVAPDYAAALTNLGNALQAQGRTGDAVACFRRALKLKPDAADVLTNLGNALAALDRLDEAAACQLRAVALRPDLAPAHTNLGTVLWRLRRPAEAEACHRRALALAPDDPEALANLGTALFDQGRYSLAEQAYRRSLALAPHQPAAISDLGRLFAATGRPAQAAAAYREALALDPSLKSARFNRGLLRLAAGDLTAGFADYEARFGAGRVEVRRRRFDRPVWQGEAAPDQRVLVWREQGLGDEILFATLYPLLARRTGALAVEADPRLIPLLARALPEADVRPESRAPDGSEPRADFDRHVAAGSLPGHLVPRLDRFPPAASPCWQAAPERAALLRRRLETLGPGLRIGLCWRSRDASAGRGAAYARLADWAPVLRIPGLHLVNLQYDECEADLRAAERQFGVAIHRWPDLDLCRDQDGVAALMTSLDLVLSAPTAVGELAGALGVPVWRLDVPGDWAMLGTRCRPWFGTMRVVVAGAAGTAAAIPAIARRLRRLAQPGTGS